MKNAFSQFPWRLLLPAMLLSATMIFNGCAAARYVPTGSVYAAKSDNCPIEVFSSKSPDREYEEIGIIEGEGWLGGDTLADVLPKMKVEACRAGGDAIIITSNQKTPNVYDGTSDSELNVTATVIRWLD
jgi:hypothetical protein